MKIREITIYTLTVEEIKSALKYYLEDRCRLKNIKKKEIEINGYVDNDGKLQDVNVTYKKVEDGIKVIEK